jgi:hypothetical protein
VKIDTVAPRSATVGISTVREFGQIDRPDFTGPLDSRLESAKLARAEASASQPAK